MGTSDRVGRVYVGSVIKIAALGGLGGVSNGRGKISLSAGRVTVSSLCASAGAGLFSVSVSRAGLFSGNPGGVSSISGLSQGSLPRLGLQGIAAASGDVVGYRNRVGDSLFKGLKRIAQITLNSLKILTHNVTHNFARVVIAWVKISQLQI